MDTTSEDALCLLIEILSGSNLLIRDKRAKSSDPYIKVKLNGQDLHSTKSILKTLNPTYTDADKNSFLLDCSAKELFDSGNLLFKVKDWNRLSSDEDMGFVEVPAMDLYKATGEPMEYALVAPSDFPNGTDAGKITIRCWPATEAHLKKFGKDKKGLRGFVSGIQSQAKESMGHIKHEVSSKIHVPQSVKDLSGKMTFAASKEEGEGVKPFRDDEDLPSPENKKAAEPDLKDEATQPQTHLHLLFEVVAGRNLLVGDSNTSDPYCKVFLGDREVHKTKHVLKTLNPIFTPETESTFLLEVTGSKLSDAGGLLFEVKDYDMIGTNISLGTVRVEHHTLIKGLGSEEALEFMIKPPKGETKQAGYLLLRWRNATSADVEAMKDTKNRKNLFGITSEEAVKAAWQVLDDNKKETEPAAEKPEVEQVSRSMEKEQPKIELKPGENMHVRIEIVKCRNLLSADKNGLSDPYVKLGMQGSGKELHKTRHILKTLNPIFSEDMDNIFTLHCPAEEFFKAGGLVVKVKDWDRIGANDELGEVDVPAATIYNNLNGNEMEFHLDAPKGKNEDAGYVTLRFIPTDSDDHTGERKKFLGIAAPKIHMPNVKVADLNPIKPMSEMLHLNQDKGLEDEEEEPIFIQIVACKNLLVADKTGSSDPYVKIKMANQSKYLHETKHIEQTLNPVYESQHNPFFVLEEKPSVVRKAGGLTFKIKDYDRIGSNDDLGHVDFGADALYSAAGENLELKITPPKGIGEDAGVLIIRCRPATESDRLATRSFFGGGAVLSKHLPLTDYGRIDLSLLIEIVSGWHLPIADMTSSDPYVKVKVGPRNIHETKPIQNTRDPIYTIRHDSVFIVDIATKELKENGGMTFKVKDYDMIGRNDELGAVTVPAETILEASGERLELQLKDSDKDAGFLAIRVRPATKYDREFLTSMKAKVRKKDFLGLQRSYQKAMMPKGGSGNRIKTLLTKMKKEENGVTKFRVRPNPDPSRPEATEFMSKHEIEAECFKESHSWLDIGSGDLGKIFVEILGADGLPNKDQDLGGGNKTDPFVSVVYEDSMAKTDTIDDCLSPRWLPWMQRAFIFRMMHTSSNLQLAVFDYDPGFVGDHDICGRVSIDLCNLQPDVEYVLRYNIYENSVMANREPKGVLMVRLRMELKEERDLILSNLQFPIPEFFVNVKNAKDFDLVRQTVGGRHDLQAYSMKTISLYLEELMGYQSLKYFIIDALVALIFWRGQVRVYGFWLPLHSLALFLSSVTLAERPSLYPSYFFFAMAWMLLACQTGRNNTQNPWNRTKTFVGLWQELLTSLSLDGPPKTIAAHQNEKESKEEEERWKERIEKAEKDAEEYQKAQMKLLEEHESMMSQVGETAAQTDISTRAGGLSFDPLKFILYPIQQYLALACAALRLVKSVLIWDEPYIAFIFTQVFFLIGVVFLVVPWAFLFRWTSRIIAWVVFGPHMKLVDMFWYSKMEELTEEERNEQIRQAFAGQLEAARALASAARIQTEDAVKLKAIKQILYGTFVTKVPTVCLERFSDIPLHSSTAKPYKKPEGQKLVVDRVAGQHLVGHMIPKIQEIDEIEEEEIKDDEAKKDD